MIVTTLSDVRCTAGLTLNSDAMPMACPAALTVNVGASTVGVAPTGALNRMPSWLPLTCVWSAVTSLGAAMLDHEPLPGVSPPM